MLEGGGGGWESHDSTLRAGWPESASSSGCCCQEVCLLAPPPRLSSVAEAMASGGGGGLPGVSATEEGEAVPVAGGFGAEEEEQEVLDLAVQLRRRLRGWEATVAAVQRLLVWERPPQSLAGAVALGAALW